MICMFLLLMYSWLTLPAGSEKKTYQVPASPPITIVGASPCGTPSSFPGSFDHLKLMRQASEKVQKDRETKAQKIKLAKADSKKKRRACLVAIKAMDEPDASAVNDTSSDEGYSFDEDPHGSDTFFDLEL